MAKRAERAIRLGGALIEDVLRSSVPQVLERKALSGAQLDQLQRVLDAEVVNPEIDRLVAALLKRARRYVDRTQYVVVDQAAEDKAGKVQAERIHVTASDHVARIANPALLMLPGATTPLTDNPDEAHHLAQVRARVKSEGLWVRLIKLAKWEALVTLGTKQGHVADAQGLVGRESLLDSTQASGDRGFTIYKDIENVRKEMQSVLAKVRREYLRVLGRYSAQAALQTGVANAFASGMLEMAAGTSFPSGAGFDLADRFIRSAERGLKTNKMYGARDSLVIAAALIEDANRAMTHYLDGLEANQGRAERGIVIFAASVAVIFVAANAALVAGGAVAVGSGGSGGAGTAAAAGGVGEAETVQTFIAEYLARNPGLAEEIARVSVARVPNAAGTVSRIRPSILLDSPFHW